MAALTQFCHEQSTTTTERSNKKSETHSVSSISTVKHSEMHAFCPVTLDVRLAELKWAVAVQELARKQREEQRYLKERLREEEKARKEYEEKMRQAAKEEELKKRAVEEAEQKVASATMEQKAY